MLDDYLALGGVELVNSARVAGYAATADCPMDWIKSEGCSALPGAISALEGLDGAPYSYEQISDAPWYDDALPDLSARFIGCYGISIDNVQDSTRTASITERFRDGGVIGRTRRAAREVIVTALLLGRGADAIDYGIQWLSAALDTDGCGQHSSRCGLTDVEFFDACPPEREPDEPLGDYGSRVRSGLRFLHDVSAISGPTIQAKRACGSRGEWSLYEVEFVLGAQEPFVFGVTAEKNLPATETQVVRDEVTNYFPNPQVISKPGDVLGGEQSGVNIVPNGSFEYASPGAADLWLVFDELGESLSTSGSRNVSRVNTTEAIDGEYVASAFFTVLGEEDVSPLSGRVGAGSNGTITIPGGTSRVRVRGWHACAVLGGLGEVVGRGVYLRAYDGAGLTLARVYRDLEGHEGTFDETFTFPATARRVSVGFYGILENGSSSTTRPQDNTVFQMLFDAIGVYVP